MKRTAITEKRCSRCGKTKPVEQFTWLKRRGGEYCSMCRACDNLRSRKMRGILRLELVRYYSGGRMNCAICAEDRIEVLDLDHIEGGGVKHRSEFRTPFAFYTSIKAAGFPLGIRVLCRNCNWIEWLKRSEQNIKMRHERGLYGQRKRKI